MKFFNTVGALRQEDHYFLPHRLNWQQLTHFIDQKYYFLLHAPRQSGKTTGIIEFVKHLNEEGTYTALYLSSESAHYAVNDVKHGIRALLSQFKNQIRIFLPSETRALEYLQSLFTQATINDEALYDFLCFWAENSTRPLAIFIDEFDGLMGDTLVAMLKQFRMGYTNRPKHFPQTICLIGIRDLRDYRMKTKEQDDLGVLYSPFNIKAESIVLPNFSQEDVKTLYLQHTTETRQQFTDEALEYAFEQTQGQPWLVNALAYQACFRDITDRSVTITKEILEQAKEALIKRRDTHLDALVDRLQEPRVRAIIDAIITGVDTALNFSIDDIQYLLDLGLVARRNNNLVITNPIYQEVLPRELTFSTELTMPQQQLCYIKPDGSLDMHKMLSEFTQFYRENSAIWLEKFDYKESGPHLFTMAFLQRIVNGGGRVHREYALGIDRVDILITWKKQRIVIELKVWHSETKTMIKGLEQTARYMDTSGATEGHLVIFDRRNKSWDEKIYTKQTTVGTYAITVWGM